jgi:hypothetical protein
LTAFDDGCGIAPHDLEDAEPGQRRTPRARKDWAIRCGGPGPLLSSNSWAAAWAPAAVGNQAQGRGIALDSASLWANMSQLRRPQQTAILERYARRFRRLKREFPTTGVLLQRNASQADDEVGQSPVRLRPQSCYTPWTLPSNGPTRPKAKPSM